MNFTDCMMKNRYVRIETAPVSEYEDRLSRVRAYMERNGIDALIDANCKVSNMGLWLTGEYQATSFAVLPKGPMYVEFAQTELLPDGTMLYPDGTPVEPNPNPGLCFVNRLDYPGLLHHAAKVGFLHIGDPNQSGDLKYSLKKRLDRAAAGKELVDATYDINRIKSERSPLEIELNRDTGKMIEQVMYAFPSICRRGRLYKEVCDDTQYLLASIGCPGDFMVCQIRAYDRDGFLLTDLDSKSPGQRVEEGHIVALLLETNGPSNHYACGARLFSFGGVSEEFQKAWDVSVEATRLAGKMICPGASLTEITAAVMKFIRNAGYNIPDNRFVQSMGYSCAEDPRSWDSAPLLPGTPIICHPSVYPKGRAMIRGEAIHLLNMYVAAPGGGQMIYSMPDDIVVL